MTDIELEYFKESILFFKEIEWIYKMPVTKVLCKDSLDFFPKDWLEVLKNIDNHELNDFVTNQKVQRNWPESLINFVNKCQRLNKLPKSNISLSLTELPEIFLKKLSVKKQHEILHLARFVHEQCQQQNISLIVDIGCGLGYICQLLNYLYGYKLLGLEYCSKKVAVAKSRQEKMFPDSLSSVKYVTYKISNNSSKLLGKIVEEEFPEIENFCLIGLHACGDLSVYMSQIYSEIEGAKLLILLSCCYQKLLHKRTFGTSKYFPHSKTLKNAVNSLNINVKTFLKEPFLRLACQETSDRWHNMSEKIHEDHSFYVLARAVLELYAVKNEIRLKKLTRKATRKSQCSNFNDFLDDFTLRYVLQKQEEDGSPTNIIFWNDKIKAEVLKLWENNVEKQKDVELYTALQLILQNTAESFVLMDQLHFLRENNFEAYIIQITNRSLSPRCYAIVSNKK